MENFQANSEFDRIRNARVPRIILICVVAWTGFGLYYLGDGRLALGIQCVLQGIAGIWLASKSLKSPKDRPSIAKLYILLVTAGLTFNAFMDGLNHAIAILFFPCVVLVASLTVGKRHIWKIALLVILAVLAIHQLLPQWMPPQTAPPCSITF